MKEAVMPTTNLQQHVRGSTQGLWRRISNYVSRHYTRKCTTKKRKHNKYALVYNTEYW